MVTLTHILSPEGQVIKYFVVVAGQDSITLVEIVLKLVQG